MAITRTIAVVALLFASASCVVGRESGTGKIAFEMWFTGAVGAPGPQQFAAQHAVASYLDKTLNQVKQFKQLPLSATSFKIDQTLFGFASPAAADAFISANLTGTKALSGLAAALQATGSFTNSKLTSFKAMAAQV